MMATQPDKVVSGLEGVLAFESNIAFIDGNKPELSYRGYDIADVARNLSYEATTYLLWHGRVPTKAELTAFTADLASRRAVSDSVL
ncbi:MAG: citrate/2-methylcitrate synthase, partial [SAR202 cluster bacterium]|nr:citrate/2-methylcitrate synthase [SAR202 cluster bacterium]